MRYEKIIPITIFAALLFSACGSSASTTSTRSDSDGMVSVSSGSQTSETFAVTETDAAVIDDTTDHMYADKAMFSYGSSIFVDSAVPLGETVIEPVTVSDSFFANSNISLLYGKCDKALRETYIQMVFDGEADEVDRSVVAYDVPANKAFVETSSESQVLCDGEATYMILPLHNSYVKKDEANLDFVKFAAGNSEEDVGSLFDKNGDIVEYNGKRYSRFKLIYGQEASQEMGYDVVSYYYFNENGDVEYNAEIFGDRLVTGVYFAQLTSDFDDSYFTCPSGYSEVENEEIMDSLFARWGISQNDTTAGDSAS